MAFHIDAMASTQDCTDGLVTPSERRRNGTCVVVMKIEA